MKITFHGTGYVGLVTGACIADTGNHVMCVDVDADKISSLQQGNIPIYEPGLDAIVQRNCGNGRLQFTTDIAKAISFADVQVIAVGTPPDEDGSADMQYVLEVANSIGSEMDSYKVIVNKSTVPVGTADKVREMVSSQLAQRGVDLDFDVVSNPEFLKEGAAVNDFMKPDRIVVGTDSDRAKALIKEMYEPFNRNHNRSIFMDIRSAELTKYAANALLATKISFINELAGIADRMGADIEQVRVGIGSDPRIGYEFIYPGCGFGGSCFPKDVRALAHASAEIGFDAELINAVERVNNRQKEVVFGKLMQHFDNDIKGRTVALWGLAFKPNTDDMREAPSRNLMEAVWAAGATIQAYDPVAIEEAKRIYGDRPDLLLCDSAESALKSADALVVVTEWREFRSPDFEQMKIALSAAVVIDGRNIYDPAHMQELGFSYYAIGRGA
ncbi:MAG: UDP-glucose/GDP-mannose dehydrogenase family protein [Gammaproteobacteria bacterium]|nr:UDP-glucose/GDP-mannose dehydrogenase family protein [Gammaproteobacteria bacterium]MCP4274884.1 UDP-glucose/GDP-mannose dehydrogenase family protein [Gammaproteobacteria bacterium]MCP4832049.1 UDP-glucose/GDP-mannose dehydrogenase family protein [Gammaproteobacteria bacterium]MCP4928350.1 UDP-glucose/GDP-mannose dehydrogenase family protein [Gammaproteobacteria bacterium]